MSNEICTIFEPIFAQSHRQNSFCFQRLVLNFFKINNLL